MPDLMFAFSFVFLGPELPSFGTFFFLIANSDYFVAVSFFHEADRHNLYPGKQVCWTKGGEEGKKIPTTGMFPGLPVSTPNYPVSSSFQLP